jgi:hypothetical protein
VIAPDITVGRGEEQVGGLVWRGAAAAAAAAHNAAFRSVAAAAPSMQLSCTMRSCHAQSYSCSSVSRTSAALRAAASGLGRGCGVVLQQWTSRLAQTPRVLTFLHAGRLC